MSMIEVSFTGYMETLEHLKYDDTVKVFRGDRGDLAWRMFMRLISMEEYRLTDGPLAAIRDFSDNDEVVYAEDFERDYPKYSSIMTWEEFVENECICGDDEVAVLNTRD